MSIALESEETIKIKEGLSMKWQRELTTNIKSVKELKNFYKILNVTAQEEKEIEEAVKQKGVNLPVKYVSDLVNSITAEKERTQIKNLLLPRLHPSIIDSVEDTLCFVKPEDKDLNPKEGLTQMYPDRVLISPNFSCMTKCEWCYRKKETGGLTDTELDEIYQYISRHKTITDVILTGGEPLFTSNERLESILSNLRRFDHVDIIRFHTRAPVVLPSRIDEDFLKTIRPYNKRGKPIYVVTHFVHPLEITEASIETVEKLLAEGIWVLNQAPVLRGVNDDQETFNGWNRKMIKYRIKPYYVAPPVIKDGINSRFYISLKKVEELLNDYSVKYDGLGKPTLIIAVLGKKMTSSQLKEWMKKYGAYVRRTKIELK